MITITETLYKKMPDDIKECFNQLPNPSSEEVRECFPESGGGKFSKGSVRKTLSEDNGFKLGFLDGESIGNAPDNYGDSGNASRFFKSIIYQAKASKSERNKDTNTFLTIEICVENTEVAQLQPKVILEKMELWFTELFGSQNMEQYQVDIKSTIETGTKQTTILLTLNYSQHLNIKEYIVGAIKTKMESGGSPAVSAVNTSELKSIIIKELTAYLLGVNPAVSPTQLKISVNAGNYHSTVKPTALMSYLIKMITPKGGIVLDPFAGSGSTLVAAKENDFQFIGIEMTKEYIPIIEARTGVKAEEIDITIDDAIDVFTKEDMPNAVKASKKITKNICDCGGKVVRYAGGRCCQDCLKDY